MISACFASLLASFRTRSALQIEILALRHQVGVLQRFPLPHDSSAKLAFACPKLPLLGHDPSSEAGYFGPASCRPASGFTKAVFPPARLLHLGALKGGPGDLVQAAVWTSSFANRLNCGNSRPPRHRPLNRLEGGRHYGPAQQI